MNSAPLMFSTLIVASASGVGDGHELQAEELVKIDNPQPVPMASYTTRRMLYRYRGTGRREMLSQVRPSSPQVQFSIG
jgi:hypothetical protein